jgi:hypothetical protein
MSRTFALSLAISLCLSAVAQAAPTIVVGNHALLANTAGQTVPIYVTGIEPNTVNGITLSVMISGGGPAYGGTAGPTITDMDFDSGPTIWMPPSVPTGHNPPATYYDGQLASANFLTVSGFVTASSGLVATLTIDMTGFGGVYSLELFGTALEENVGNTDFIGQNFVSSITNGTVGWVPEPSSIVLGLIGLASFGVVAIRKRRARRM